MTELTATQIVAEHDPEKFESTDSDLSGYWHFCGDINLEHGGTFYNLDPADLQYGYCDATRVTDLDSAIGFTGAVMIERLTVCFLDDLEKIEQGLACCGWIPDDWSNTSPAGRVGMIVDSMIAYGHYDPANCFPDHHMETLQLESDGDMSFDGWTADKRIRGDLRRYVLSKHVG